MTIQEMHIDLDINGQRINSSVFADVRPEEKDIIINRAIKTFVNRRANPRTNLKKEGYEQSQKRVVDLESITKTVPIQLYKKDNYTVKGILPANYYQFVDANASVIYGCQSIASSLTLVNINKSVCAFGIKDDGTTFYKDLTIIVRLNTPTGIVSNTIFDLTALYPYYANGLLDTDAKFTAINLISDAFAHDINYNIRWEKFDGKTFYNKFILENLTGYSLIDVTVTTATNTETFTPFTASYTSYEIPDTNILPVKDDTDVREISSEMFGLMRNSNMGSSTYRSLIAKVEDDIIEISHGSTFTPITLNLTYIKEPDKVNIRIGRNCDLAYGIHEEIMNNAVEHLKSRLDGSYQITKTENLINE